MPDIETYVEQLHLTQPLREPAMRAAISQLNPPPGSQGLDAGCGTGSLTLMLAEAVGPEGHVTGLDLEPEFVLYARAAAEDAGLPERVDFREGDVRHMPFDDDAFDWAWSVDCVGYAPLEPLPLIEELARVVEPGGKVAILAWSSQQFLPGYPLLEARLNVTSAGIAPFVEGRRPASHFFRALGWFHQVGLEECLAHTFSVCVQAPLSHEQRQGILSLLEMRWPGVESELATEDWEQFQRLVRPESTEFILDLPDYYGFFTYTMFEGRVAA
jgi:demethylmenaquinone methyltransferase/2-methoxy-6-polyprenyl-1,4-benzoquinol methylase